MDFRTDSRGLLLDLLETTATFSQERLAGMTDDEYLWEPVRPCWSLRNRNSAAGRSYGPGDYQLEHSDGDEAVFTTIGWRLAHLTSGFAARWEWTFGSRAIPPDDVVDFAATADGGLDQLWSWYQRWHDGIVAMDEADFVRVGYSQMPTGLDPDVPFASIVWWQAREMVHHLAEAALLRDLYAARSERTAL